MTFIAKDFNELTTVQLYEILKSRAKIFMLEQKISCLDMDDVDYRSRHFFLESNSRVAAYLRAFYKNEEQGVVQIGRVLTLDHGVGWGRRLMEETIDHIKQNLNCTKICVDAQKTAVGFYEKFGFRVVSEEFLEEGIVHVAMELRILAVHAKVLDRMGNN